MGCGMGHATSRDWSLRREVQQGQVLSTIWSSWQGNLLRSVHGTHEHPCSIVLCGWSSAHGRIPALQFSFPRHSFGLLTLLHAQGRPTPPACECYRQAASIRRRAYFARFLLVCTGSVLARIARLRCCGKLLVLALC